MPRGSETEALLLALRTCFSDVPLARARLVLQVFSETWGEFVDAPLDLALQGKLKLRAVPAPQKISLERGSTMFFCCDMQERFRPAVKHFADITAVAQRLLRGAAVLGIPVVATEQYPKGLGSTVEELYLVSAQMVLPKTQFSMLLPEVLTLLQNSPNISSIVLFGVETHVCIQQTTLDLLSCGYAVYIVADASSSRSDTDRHLALQRLAQAGAVVTTSESVLLQVVGGKDHPDFKEIQQLIRELLPTPGLPPGHTPGSNTTGIQ
uniref:Isochorismatase domain-containing protein 1 n=1 Tax=Eptatretus burgeri TaxID=7764 RepID=A0A8C4QQ64_EPTBU